MSDEQKPFVPELLAQAFLDHGDVGVIGIDAHGVVVIWNTWIAGRTGIAPSAAIGRPLLALFDPPPVRLWDEMQAVLHSGSPRILSPVLHADWLPFLMPTRLVIRLLPLCAAVGEPTGLLALINDV
ncbi:MAG: PAS domain-containing protein, partial [Anaerolineae bacterium]|nr:PAS domain-containing protein [Anaerolineae bacterium]